MINHVVMFKFKEEGLDANVQKALEMLKALPEKVEGALKFEVGRNISASPFAHELVLVSAFKDSESLMAYSNHPEHQKFVQYIVTVTDGLAEADYEG